ncbi:ABC transporter substrate-binding protein [Phytohabitans suffuscus]|uniref:Putative ABC transporter periplasmic-binding protein YcjN n=1 Tax=Phytohabitans suffuscus TaxID=624315 RepID=A0A6F8YRJ0_9ACTN|nr:sugar ABC transporter substrate-binding protein [Phytohabitans suffuscus]BCB88676.1 putative ABC transporter periplasmic-binding protein YcjN [Phytohabitans suffuscus]
MRFLKLKRAAVGALALAVVLPAAACGGSSGPSGGGDDKTLTLWHMEQPPNRVAAFQKVIDAYNATNPEYKVQAQVQDWNQIYTKISSAVQSKTQPDILFTIPDFTTYVRPLGAVRPVTALVDELDKEHTFGDAAKAAYRDDNEYWAVPLYGMVQMLWYRKDLFAKAGITDAPKTWSELLADAQKLTSGSQKGIAVPAGKNLATDQVIYSLMLTGGAGNFFTGGGEVAFDKPQTVAALSLYADLLKQSPSDAGNYSWGEPQAAFNSGAVAMAIEKGQYLAPFEKESGRPASDLGCAPIPQADTGGEPGSIYYSNAAMVLSGDDVRAKGAEDFLRFVLKPENYGPFLNAEPGLFLPLTEDGAKAPSWTDNEVIKKYQGCVDAMLEQSKTGGLFGFVDGQYVDSIGKISGQNILAQVVQRVYSSGESPAAAVKWGDQQMREAVAR